MKYYESIQFRIPFKSHHDILRHFIASCPRKGPATSSNSSNEAGPPENICDDFVKGCNKRAKVCSALSTHCRAALSIREDLAFQSQQINVRYMEPICSGCRWPSLPGDASALSPGGVRVGAPAMTTRGCTQEDWNLTGTAGLNM